mmetsp:Transcript_28586/g.83854  ORF Transcript_28586/g.83854 Transcript_28586/m.83854 type:complete len:220 (+) Transcript_28586:388-1047(+)
MLRTVLARWDTASVDRLAGGPALGRAMSLSACSRARDCCSTSRAPLPPAAGASLSLSARASRSCCCTAGSASPARSSTLSRALVSRRMGRTTIGRGHTDRVSAPIASVMRATAVLLPAPRTAVAQGTAVRSPMATSPAGSAPPTRPLGASATAKAKVRGSSSSSQSRARTVNSVESSSPTGGSTTTAPRAGGELTLTTVRAWERTAPRAVSLHTVRVKA